MARQLEELKSQRADEPGKSTESPSFGDVSDVSPNFDVEYPYRLTFDDSDLIKEQFELADFVIDRETVVEVYYIFSYHFHPHLPMFEPSHSIAFIHDSSPLLFWTIIAIVLARQLRPNHGDLFKLLEKPFTKQLKSDFLSAPLPIHTIQALLYLITFPFPTDSQTREPSWLYCGIALNASLYMGLQKSKPTQSLRSIGVVPGTIRARARTWLACFVASTSLSLFVGSSPLIHSTGELENIMKFTHEQPLPLEYMYEITVQHTLAKFTSVLLNDARAAVNLAVVQLVDGELDGLKAKSLAMDWTSRTEYCLLVAKLHLYAMTVIKMQSDITSRNILLQLGLSVSLRIVYLMERGLGYESNQYTDVPVDLLPRTCPKNHFRGLLLASIFLLRYFALNDHATAEEQELARNSVSIAHTYFKSISAEPSDEQDRGARLLASLSRQKPVNIDNFKPRVDDRLGASLLYDAITTGHELRNDNIEAEEIIPATVTDTPDVADYSSSQHNIVVPEFDTDPMEGLNDLDFTLPADLWGDTMWGMFDFNMVPPPPPR
ncbi:hypothetical protein B0J11DRAFT_581370 [Dendryphion nanum]|uniref:Xylanolytic transcriptional activator regulatory domain-containing protein n=1 Tax=Dendryphion nanum TaxID=256645 RepID=A0A9P9DNH9_9PLEO|nr:hypothetical protein B0J11DRAFT_581370 [Dendryphion nanum]